MSFPLESEAEGINTPRIAAHSRLDQLCDAGRPTQTRLRL